MARRLFLDTNVYVDGFEVPDSAQGRLLAAAGDGQFEVVASDLLLEELRHLMGRLQGKEAGFEAAMLIVELPARRFVVEVEWKRGLDAITPFVRDQRDGPHLASAYVSRSFAFVTRNRRSVQEGIFDFVPLVSPERAWEAIVGKRGWPTVVEMRDDWMRWAKKSPRAPREGQACGLRSWLSPAAPQWEPQCRLGSGTRVLLLKRLANRRAEPRWPRHRGRRAPRRQGDGADLRRR